MGVVIALFERIPGKKSVKAVGAAHFLHQRLCRARLPCFSRARAFQ